MKTVLVLIALFSTLVLFDRRPDGQTFILAHNLSEKHPVHKGMELFRDILSEESNGKLKVKIFANAQLGSEREVLELVQLGAIGMTKVSSMSVEQFAPLFGVLNLPYIFKGKEHNYAVLDSEIGERLLAIPTSKKLRGLTYYDAGARSFYANKPIHSPDDLVGLKIRVMGSPTAIAMTKLLGAAPTPMPYGEVYTGLQQGVIDGAENNVTALTLVRHGEVISHYSLDEHAMFPDVLIMSEVAWSRLSNENKKLIKSAASRSRNHQRKLWQEIEVSGLEDAKKMGVEVVYPPKEPFIEKVSPLHESFAEKSPEHRELVETIKSF